MYVCVCVCVCFCGWAGSGRDWGGGARRLPGRRAVRRVSVCGWDGKTIRVLHAFDDIINGAAMRRIVGSMTSL
jgi:hypothetical protein